MLSSKIREEEGAQNCCCIAPLHCNTDNYVSIGDGKREGPRLCL